MLKTLKIELKLLNHPWYRQWECGALPVDSLRHYAGEYYWQVAHFPRYLSRLHSQLDSLSDRQVILGNLADEENRASPHPELWLDFAEALGLAREKITSSQPGPAAARLIAEFQGLVAAGPAQGLGAILAYEAQVPEVASFKGKALRQHYLAGLADAAADKAARFFSVHEATDVWHTRELDELVERLPAEGRQKAQAAATHASHALWNFLDAMPN